MNEHSGYPVTDLTALRKHLHQQPELSNAEHDTARHITNLLQALQPDHLITGLGGTGVAATFTGQQPGAHVLFRCELDALPIEETNDFAHRSCRPGAAHKCGHDGHITILCGLAEWLAADRAFAGQRSVLFQPAEETGEGALAVVQDPRFQAMNIDYCYALHNLPGVPLGDILIKAGPFNCASCGLAITIPGVSAHAAYPEQGRAPTFAMMALISELDALNDELTGDELRMLTLTHSQLGEPSFGSTPAYAKVGLTLRTETTEAMQALKNQVLARTNAVIREHGFQCQQQWHDDFQASVNDPDCAARVARSAEALGYTVQWLDEPMRWSEDFGAISATARGAMFVIGAGTEVPQIHHPAYDFPDALIQPAIRLFAQLSQAHNSPENHQS
jgi:amidohydrolase